MNRRGKMDIENKHYIYRFLEPNDEIVYIGRTSNNLETRIKQHFYYGGHLGEDAYNTVYKVEYVALPNKIDAQILESYLINKYKPMYNKDFTQGETIVSISKDLEWVNFEFSSKSKLTKEKDGSFVEWKGRYYPTEVEKYKGRPTYLTRYIIPDNMFFEYFPTGRYDSDSVSGMMFYKNKQDAINDASIHNRKKEILTIEYRVVERITLPEKFYEDKDEYGF